MRVSLKSRSMFTLLYIEILLGLLVTIAIFMHFGHRYLREADIDIFVDDGLHHAQRYINSRYERNGLHWKLNQYRELDFFDYKLKLISSYDVDQPLCTHCTMHLSSQGVRVYMDEDELLQLALPIPNSIHHLVFIETDNPFSDTTPWYKDRELLFLLSLFTTVSLALGIFIYLPIHLFNRRMERLILAQARFGKGDLSSRAEEYPISPLKDIARSFNDMAEEIENRVKQSQLFSHAIPHEIRTPLTKIQMACDLAKRDDCANRHYLLNKIDDHIEDVSHLTRDILQLSKLTGQIGADDNLEKEQIELATFLRKRLSVIAIDQALLIVDEEEEQGSIVASLTLAKLVIDNLIKNADRYGNGRVELTLRKYATCWAIDIEDNGCGIPVDKRDEIFLAFSRLDLSRSRDSGGFGLGLAIAQNAAKNLGWSISVDDSVLGGARFSVVIPTDC